MPTEWKSQLQGLRQMARGLLQPAAEPAVNGAANSSGMVPASRFEMTVEPPGDSREDIIRGFVDAMPLSAAAHLALGRAMRETGRQDEAIAAYRAALMLDPSAQSARAALSELGELTRLITAGDTANR